MKDKKGFTLIEILIVIVTLGILIGVAVPAYQVTIEKSRRSEAVQNLSAIRQSEIRYYTQFGSYTDDLQKLDVRPAGVTEIKGSPLGGQATNFGYAISSASADGFAAHATRLTNPQGYDYSIEINEQGMVREISAGRVSNLTPPDPNRIIHTTIPRRVIRQPRQTNN